jgi:hypothetical protein
LPRRITTHQQYQDAGIDDEEGEYEEEGLAPQEEQNPFDEPSIVP